MSTWRSIKFYIFHLSSYKESDICSLSLELLLNLLPSIGIRTDTPKQLACRHGRYIWRFWLCPSAGFLLLYSINYYCMISFSKTKKKTNRHLWEVCLVWVWEQDENRKKKKVQLKDGLGSVKTWWESKRAFLSEMWFADFTVESMLQEGMQDRPQTASISFCPSHSLITVHHKHI